MMDQEEEDGGSASCDKVSRPRPPHQLKDP